MKWSTFAQLPDPVRRDAERVIRSLHGAADDRDGQAVQALLQRGDDRAVDVLASLRRSVLRILRSPDLDALDRLIDWFDRPELPFRPGRGQNPPMPGG